MLNRAQFLEPRINREASQYLLDNYNEVVLSTIKMGVKEEKAYDLVNDVYVSLRNSEDEGNGYNINGKNGEGYILVESFVYGRIKNYAKNVKYRTDICESKKKGEIRIISASSDDSDLENLESFQKAYAMAKTADSVSIIDAEVSLVEDITYCITFNNQVKMNMLALFKNIDKLASYDFDKSLFEPIRALASSNAEFAEAFRSVIEFSMKDKHTYDLIVSKL